MPVAVSGFASVIMIGAKHGGTACVRSIVWVRRCSSITVVPGCLSLMLLPDRFKRPRCLLRFWVLPVTSILYRDDA